MDFLPTYLYIKRHAITGKCYFGKTNSKNPYKYLGSGIHWKRHIKLHGVEHVETLWCKLFIDQIECTRVALLFSEQQDIIKSDRWLNLVIENGIDGGSHGKLSAETRAKMSASRVGKKRKPLSPEHKAKISATKKGKTTNPRSLETKIKIANSLRGKKLSSEHKKKLSQSHKGITPSSETKAKMSATRKNKKLGPQSQEHRNKISIAKRGKNLSQEHRAKISAGLLNRNQN